VSKLPMRRQAGQAADQPALDQATIIKAELLALVIVFPLAFVIIYFGLG